MGAEQYQTQAATLPRLQRLNAILASQSRRDRHALFDSASGRAAGALSGTKFNSETARAAARIGGKLTDEQAIYIRDTVLSVGAKALADELGVTPQTIRDVARGKTFQHLAGAIKWPRHHVPLRVKEASEKRRGRYGYLTDEQVAYARQQCLTRTCADLARELGYATPQGMYFVCTGKSYGHLPGAVPKESLFKRPKAAPKPREKKALLPAPGLPDLSGCKTRNAEILALHNAGWTMVAIGQRYGLTRARVQQISVKEPQRQEREQRRLAIAQQRLEQVNREKAARDLWAFTATLPTSAAALVIRQLLTPLKFVPETPAVSQGINPDEYLVSWLKLAPRIQYGLIASGMGRVGMVRNASDEDLLRIKGIGPGALSEVRAAVSAFDERMKGVGYGR